MSKPLGRSPHYLNKNKRGFWLIMGMAMAAARCYNKLMSIPRRSWKEKEG